MTALVVLMVVKANCLIGLHRFSTVEKALARVQETIGHREAQYWLRIPAQWHAACLFGTVRYKFCVFADQSTYSDGVIHSMQNDAALCLSSFCWTEDKHCDLLCK